MYFELTDSFVVSADLERTWEFFSSAENLPAITPAFLKFRITTPGPIHLQLDSILDYTIRVVGVPVRWRTRIIHWCPPKQFIDLQIRGPYTLWHHQHSFEETAAGVFCRDRVIYKVPPMGAQRLANAILVKPRLLEIFRFRRSIIGQRLGWVRAVQKDVEIRKLT